MKCFINSIIFSLLIINCYSQDPAWQWGRAFGSPNEDYTGDITVDGNGNLYSLNSFNSPWIIFGTDTVFSTGGTDMLLTKYNPQGNIIWMRHEDGTAKGVTTDAAGNIYIASNTGYNISILKYNSSGTLLWSRNYGNPNIQVVEAIAVDSDENIYLTGHYIEVVSEAAFDAVTLAGFNSRDIFTAKFNSTGTCLWAKTAGGNGYDQGMDICVDINNNIYVTGTFKASSVTFGSTNLPNNGTSAYSFFLVKYDSAGNALWAKGASNTQSSYGYSVTTDASGNVIVTGTCVTPTTFSGLTINTGSIMIAKYDSLGNIAWVKGTDSNTGTESASEICSDINGNVYIVGEFIGNYIIVDSDTTYLEGTNYDPDVFILKIDQSGIYNWTKRLGGIYYEYGNCIAVDGDQNIYVSGEYGGNHLYVGNNFLDNKGERDVFIGKINQSIIENCSATFTLYPDPLTEHNWYLIPEVNGIPPFIYNWQWGDVLVSTGEYPSHTYDEPSYYNICMTVIDSVGCTVTYCDSSTYIYKTEVEMITVNVVSQLPVNINETENNIIKVYPNPANSNVTIETEQDKGTYQLQDLTGKQLLSGTITATKFNLDISALSKGIYLLSLFDGEQQAHRKIVKE